MLILVGIIIGLFILIASITWIANSFSKHNVEPDTRNVTSLTECCGVHENCEFEQMLKRVDEIIYFEDEDLDRYKGFLANDYNTSQIEEFRDVLYTLDSKEIRQWLLSIERRKIQLPTILRQEALNLLTNS